MALYRWDCQKRVVTDLVPSGVYYWTNVHYVRANGPTEFNATRLEVFNTEWRAHNSSIMLDWFLCREWPHETVVQKTFVNIPGFLATGPIVSLFASIYIGFRAGVNGHSYKRFRCGLREEDIQGDLLSPSFRLLLAQHNLDQMVPYWVNHRTFADEPLSDCYVLPEVRLWQFRHGTKRSVRRRIV